MAEQEATPLEGDVISVSSRTSTIEEPCPCPSPEPLNEPERKRKYGQFPARNVSDGRTSARTCLPFTLCKKPEMVAVNSKDIGERILKEKKLEVRMSRDYYQSIWKYYQIVYCAQSYINSNQASSIEFNNSRVLHYFTRYLSGKVYGSLMTDNCFLCRTKTWDCARREFQNKKPNHRRRLLRHQVRRRNKKNIVSLCQGRLDTLILEFRLHMEPL